MADPSYQQQQTELEYEYHRPWDHQTTFAEALANQMRMAPYFLASLAAHALIGLLFAGFEVLNPPEAAPPQLEVLAPPPPPPPEQEEPPPPPEEEQTLDEPVLNESDVVEETTTQETLEQVGDPNFTSDAPFDSNAWNNAVGLGGGAGGKHGVRGGRGGAKKGSPTEAAVEDALRWLADHQSEEGFWDCDEFFYNDKFKDQPPSDGPGSPVNDVGITGLALLAFLGHGDTMSTGVFADNVRRGITWLKTAQLDNGLFGDDVGNPTLYNHAIATMAVAEAYLVGRSPILKPTLEKAVRIIVNARNPYQAWRYRLDPNGDNDSSITGWMVFALETARDGGIPVDKDVFDGADAWFTTMTDGAGRTGYTLEAGPGSRPSRKQIYITRFPPEKSESLTAVALLCRMFMKPEGLLNWKDHPQYESMKKQVELISKTPPVWDEQGGTIDFYYWYYATFAMYQWGEKAWKDWQTDIEKALLQHQRKDGNFKGSWDCQFEPWGDEGGRVYTTALGCIILEVYYRYARLTGAR